MAERKSDHKTIRGFIILGSILGVAVLIFFLDDILRNLREPYRIVAVLPEAERVAPGTPVWVAGKEVGVVLETSFLPVTGDTAARVAALVTLPGETRAVLRADSDIRLHRPTPLGAPVLEMSPGSAGAPRLNDGDTLRAPAGTRVTATLATAVSLYGELDSLVVESGTLIDAIDARGRDVEALQRSVGAANRALDELRTDLAAGPVRLLDDTGFRAHVENARRNVAELARLFRMRADQLAPLGDAATGDSADATGLAQRLRDLASELQTVAALLDSPAGTIGRMREDSALILALDSVRTQLDSLIAEARRDPGRFIF
ncbi:MAG: MlaD family protein [Longimicrobiales bacterium]